MKNKRTLARNVWPAALLLPLLLQAGTTVAKPAQPKGGKATKGANSSKKGGAVKHAEEVLGRPLTEAQKTAVRAAQKQRAQAIKPIQEKYRASVAKALGLSLAQYEEREKALRQKKKQG